MTKSLPDTITHLDIIKTVAVVLMIIDHIGYYFLQGTAVYEWFRLFGRIGGAPIWLFLIGYAMTRDLSNKLLIGALVLAVADIVLSGSPFPFNILVTIIALRVGIDWTMEHITYSRYIFWLSSVILALAYPLTSMLFEYGSLAILYAMAGYMVRHRETLYQSSFFKQPDYYGFLTFTVMAYVVLETAQFKFSDMQEFLLLLMTAGTMAIMATMQSMTFPQITDARMKNFLMFCGRKTLEIYVVHLLLFKVIFNVILALK